MQTTFDYAQFRREFITLKQSTMKWWQDPALWRTREYCTPTHRPTEDAALDRIYHEAAWACPTKRDTLDILTLWPEDARRVLREAWHEKPLRDVLARRGRTLNWFAVNPGDKNLVRVEIELA
jgi:hypothetical protein